MRRSSIITIILLVLVIIGLTVALVVTNVPEKEQNNNDINEEQIENEDNVGEVEEETPTYMALDSDIAKDMTKRLMSNMTTEFFYATKDMTIEFEDLSNQEKMAIACGYEGNNILEDCTNENNGYAYKITKENLDKAMLKVFGNVDYTPEDINVGLLRYKYDEDKQTFYTMTGGGGGVFSHSVTGTYKIEEYSDRYEVYQKYIFVAKDYELLDNGAIIGTVWKVLDWNSYRSNELGRYKELYIDSNADSNLQTLGELVSGVEMKSFARLENSYYGEEDELKLLSKYYDQASEYKHTFMKNADGTYYWVKSELIK